MGIDGFFKWLKKQFPLCITNTQDSYKECNTLFIDLCQLCIGALKIVNKKMSDLPEEQQMQNYLDISIRKIKKTILTINPHDTIFAFFDGSCPAIKFQRKRERYFEGEYIENYVIDPTDYKLSDVNNCRDRLIVQKLFEYFTQVASYYRPINADKILFSTFFSQGEAEHKYFEVFRDLKKKENWKKNQLHSIFSFDNDLIILALQFFDEHFIVMKDFNTIVDISILRDLFLYQMIQKDLFFIEENSVDEIESKDLLHLAQELIKKVPLQLQKQVINDIMAMSFIIGSDYLPKIPDLDGLSFSKLLNTYKKINEKYFLSTISVSKNDEEDVEFSPLIVNDCFSVPSLQKLIRECFKDKITKDDQLNNNNNNNYNNINDNDNDDNNDNDNNINDNDNNINDNDDDNNNDNNNSNYSNTNDNKEDTGNNNDNNIDINTNDWNDNELNVDEASQHMLRIFNFMWIYYMKGCPSWTYYYPFKYAPPISVAVEKMHQEGPEVFNTPGSMVKTDNLFKTFINHSVQYKENLPWQLYRIKIPPSEYAHFWPLGAREANDVPMIDLELLKRVFEEEKKKVSKEDLEYTGYTDNLYYIFYNKRGNRQRRFQNPDQQTQQQLIWQHQRQIQQQINQQLGNRKCQNQQHQPQYQQNQHVTQQQNQQRIQQPNQQRIQQPNQQRIQQQNQQRIQQQNQHVIQQPNQQVTQQQNQQRIQQQNQQVTQQQNQQRIQQTNQQVTQQQNQQRIHQQRYRKHQRNNKFHYHCS